MKGKVPKSIHKISIFAKNEIEPPFFSFHRPQTGKSLAKNLLLTLKLSTKTISEIRSQQLANPQFKKGNEKSTKNCT